MTYSRYAVPSPRLQDAAQAGVIIVVPWILRPRRFWRRLALENIPCGMLQNFPDLRAALAEKKGVKKFTLHCDMQTAHTPIRPIKKNAALRMEGGTNVTGCFPLYSLYPHMHDSTVAARIPACADNSLISGIFPLDLHSPAGTVFAAFPLARLFWRSRLGERL